jgi:hypothetical protein
MPLMMNNDDSMQLVKTTSNYGFSAVKIDKLQASKYTLVTVVSDASGSVDAYAKELESCLKTIVSACQKSPMVDNLMMRLVQFNSGVNETHGFKLLADINPDDYNDSVHPAGQTALYDATYTAIEATRDYAKLMKAQDYLSNAIVFVLTDGCDNASTYGAKEIKKLIEKIKLEEVLETLTVVLVGVNSTDPSLTQILGDMQKDAGITQFIDIGTATPSKLAKLSNFISQSVS